MKRWMGGLSDAVQSAWLVARLLAGVAWDVVRDAVWQTKRHGKGW
jgi:hypothetical protein